MIASIDGGNSVFSFLFPKLSKVIWQFVIYQVHLEVKQWPSSYFSCAKTVCCAAWCCKLVLIIVITLFEFIVLIMSILTVAQKSLTIYYTLLFIWSFTFSKNYLILDLSHDCRSWRRELLFSHFSYSLWQFVIYWVPLEFKWWPGLCENPSPSLPPPFLFLAEGKCCFSIPSHLQINCSRTTFHHRFRRSLEGTARVQWDFLPLAIFKFRIQAQL